MTDNARSRCAEVIFNLGTWRSWVLIRFNLPYFVVFFDSVTCAQDLISKMLLGPCWHLTASYGLFVQAAWRLELLAGS